MGSRYKFFRFVSTFRRLKTGQDGRMGAHPIGTALGDLECVGKCFGQILEALAHLVRRGEMMIRRHLAPILNRHISTLGNT